MKAAGDTIIEVRGLRNSFGEAVIHENLDLDVRRGEILGVVGGSGTGKSVLMRSIIGLQTPDAGEITVFLITHDLDTLYAICDRIAVIADRKIVAVGTIPQLLALDHEWIQEYFRGPRGRAAELTAAASAKGEAER